MKRIILAAMAVISTQAYAAKEVSFAKQVAPIFHEYCLSCHAPGKAGFEASGLDLGSYQGLMKGTKFGPVVKPGDSMASSLVVLVEGRADPSIRMPHGAQAPVPASKIKLLKRWIEQGAKDN